LQRLPLVEEVLFDRRGGQVESIYQFDDPRTGEIIYIGVTSNLKNRLRKHLSRTGLLYPLAQELKAEGLDLGVSVLETIENPQKGREVEKKWIQIKKPLLNIIHNQEGRNQREEEERYAQKVIELMHDKGFKYREAILYMEHFYMSEGDAYTYEITEKTAEITREVLGRVEPLTGSEIVKIALKYRGIEGEK
jgi:predicted GIY-YIG superfamily endonuclease